MLQRVELQFEGLLRRADGVHDDVVGVVGRDAGGHPTAGAHGGRREGFQVPARIPDAPPAPWVTRVLSPVGRGVRVLRRPSGLLVEGAEKHLTLQGEATARVRLHRRAGPSRDGRGPVLEDDGVLDAARRVAQHDLVAAVCQALPVAQYEVGLETEGRREARSAAGQPEPLVGCDSGRWQRSAGPVGATPLAQAPACQVHLAIAAVEQHHCLVGVVELKSIVEHGLDDHPVRGWRVDARDEWEPIGGGRWQLGPPGRRGVGQCCLARDRCRDDGVGQGARRCAGHQTGHCDDQARAGRHVTHVPR